MLIYLDLSQNTINVGDDGLASMPSIQDICPQADYTYW
jgi:hypothetical protein